MKRTVCILFALLFTVLHISLFLSLSTVQADAATNTSLLTSYLKYFKKEQYSKAKQYLKQMKKTDRDTSLHKMTKKQKKAYYKMVKRYHKKYHKTYYIWGYYLADLDRDKSPELLIKYGSCEADATTVVYTFKKNKTVKAGKIYATHTSYVAYPGKGVLEIEGHMGACSVSVVTMKHGKIASKDYGFQMPKNDDYCLPTTGYLNPHTKYKGMKWVIEYGDLK